MPQRPPPPPGLPPPPPPPEAPTADAGSGEIPLEDPTPGANATSGGSGLAQLATTSVEAVVLAVAGGALLLGWG